MKIKIITKGLTVSEINVVKKGMEKVKSFLPQLNFTYETTDKNFTSTPFKNDVAEGYLPNGNEIISLADGTDHILCLIYDWTLINPRPTNPATYLMTKGITIPMGIPKQWYGGNVDVLVQYFLHEMSHAEHFRAGLKDLTHDFYSSPFVQVPGGQKDYYLFLLNRILKAPAGVQVSAPVVKKYKYFSPKEIVGLKDELVEMLDKAREIAGTPFIITSGYRTDKHNDDVGGVEDSSHLSGVAADLAIKDSTKRYAILKALLAVGFNRIGIYKTHIHCDCDKTKTQNVIWYS